MWSWYMSLDVRYFAVFKPTIDGPVKSITVIWEGFEEVVYDADALHESAHSVALNTIDRSWLDDARIDSVGRCGTIGSISGRSIRGGRGRPKVHGEAPSDRDGSTTESNPGKEPAT